MTFVRQRKTISAIVKNAYHLHFVCKIGDQDKSWAPHICCSKCATSLSQWLNGKRYVMSFVVRTVWREPSNHTNDCYFCTVPPASGGITEKKRSAQYCIRIYRLLSDQFRTAKDFPFPNLRKNLPSIQMTSTETSRSRVLLSRRRLLNHTSTEPHVYRTTRLPNRTPTEPHVY